MCGQCDQQTGRCSSCENGYWGDKCDQQCSTGCQNSQCDQQTGYCQSCRSGYWGDFCNETCLSSRCKNNQCNQADDFPEACADEPKQSDPNTDEAAYSEIMDTPNVALVDVTQKDDDDTSESGHYYSLLDGPRGERSVYTKPVFKDVPAASDNQDYANAEVSQSQVYVNTSARDNPP
nr:hypothetical protein BaRGS_005950 [Batillaria attramentaria]